MLEGKAAIVTGGSRGIGLAIATELVKAGASVLITGTRQANIDAAVKALGAKAAGARADVRSYEDVERAVKTAVDRFGRLDILVNNAGIGVFTPVAGMSVEQWNDVIGTNLTGVFHCCRAALPHLRARGAGWIVNISSLAAKNPFPDGAAYCATKAGLNAFSESLMQEVRYDNIRVSYIMPGSVATGFAGRGADGEADWKIAAEDVAEVVMDLVRFPSRSLPSRIELRPSKPRK